MGQHLNEFCKQYSTWVMVLLIALLFDTVSTIYFMRIIGVEYELNPFVRHSAIVFGPVIGTFLAAFVYKAIVGVLLAAYLKRLRMYVFLVPTITSTLAGMFNFLV